MMPDNNSSAFCDHFPMGIRCSSVCAKLRIPLDCFRDGLSLALINAEYVGFDCFVVISVLVQMLSASTHHHQHRIFMLGIVMLQSSQRAKCSCTRIAGALLSSSTEGVFALS
jgi:hypothetical protein